jgi:hypothetical protein
VKDHVPSPDVIRDIQRDALSHLARTSHAVAAAIWPAAKELLAARIHQLDKPNDV